MDNRKPLDVVALSLMALVCLIWALQQIGLKATAGYAAPVIQVGLRSGIAALCVWALIKYRGESVQMLGRVAYAGAGAGLLFALEFLLLGESLKLTSASHVVVFLYTAPIFSALGLHQLIPSERLAPAQWFGILVCAVGISVAFLQGNADDALPGMLIGDLLALLAGAAWGATTIVIRTTSLSQVPPAHVVLYQLIVAFAVLTGAAFATGQYAIVPSWSLLANMTFQALIVSVFSFLVWFRLLKTYFASQLGVFSFGTPLLGVVLGVVLLGEPLTAAFVWGAVAVIAGMVIVSSYPWFRRRYGNLARTALPKKPVPIPAK